MTSTRGAVLAAVLLLGCASGAPSPAATAAPTTAEPAIARRPYSPEEIRGHMPVGSWTRYRLEQPGRPPVLRTTTVVAADEEGVTMSATLVSEAGAPLAPPREQQETWVGLQHHATFPRDATVVTEERLDTPAGRWDCWLYTVSTTRDGAAEVARFHFAKDKPGAPVRYEQLVDGHRVFLMTLVGLGSAQ